MGFSTLWAALQQHVPASDRLGSWSGPRSAPILFTIRQAQPIGVVFQVILLCKLCPSLASFFCFPAFNCLPARHPAPSLSFLLCTLSTSQQPFLLTTAESFGNSSYPGEEEQGFHTRACAGQQRERPAGKSRSQRH